MFDLPLLRRLAEYQQYPELREGCEACLEEHDDVRILPLLAQALAHLGEPKQAEETLKRALSEPDGLDVDAWVDVAAVYIIFLKLGKAIEVLQQQLTSEPDHGMALARLGWCYMHTGKLPEALESFEQSLQVAPGRMPVYINLTRLYLLQSDTEKAQRGVDEAITQLNTQHKEMPDFVLNSNIQQLRILQLEVWIASEQFAQAEEWLEEKRGEIDEEAYLPLLIGYARQLAHNDRHEQASELLRDGRKHFKDSIELHTQLAELAQLQGQFMPATKLLHRAIRLAVKQKKESAGLWVKLSAASLHSNDKKARNAAEKSVELTEAMEEDEEHPPHMVRMLRLQAKHALAQVESHEQNYDIAEPMFRDILEENPRFVPALQGLGQQQMQRGNIDEAVALFERVKEIEPEQGYSALINARVFPEDEAALQKMEAMAKRPSLEGSVRSGMLFQLASAWEKRKAYDKAFEMASLANESSKKFLKYDGKKHRDHCARVRHGFCRALYEHRKECGVDSTLPVYVLGMPRSGTTLVEQILSGHSDIFGAGELGVIPQVVQGLNRWERHVGSKRPYPDCVDDLTPYVTAGIANNVLEELQEYSPNAKHIVDKLPHNFENIGLIKFLFPNAKIISVRRDPRDIAMSNYFTNYQAKHGGMGFAYDLTDIGEQLADHNMLMHHWSEVFPGEILEVNYEDVVDDLEGSARRMIEYIGLEWEPQVLDFNKVERAVKTASVWQVRQPIYKTSKAKWERYRDHLEPLTRGTNAPIEHDPIDMISLPEPGFLTNGVDLYKKDDLDGAELSFKKMLHHNPEHAAANYMVGLVYLSKHNMQEGIELIEKALKKCPWQKEWRKNLIKAYEQVGETEKAKALKKKMKRRRRKKQQRDEATDKKGANDSLPLDTMVEGET